MNRFLQMMILLASGVLVQPALAGEYDFIPGLWQTTTKLEMKGMPAQMAGMMAQAPKTTKSCAKNSDHIFESDKQCQYEKKRISASKVQVAVSCNGGQNKGSGEINFHGKKADGWFEMTMSQGPAGPMVMKSSFAATYLGACK